MTIVGMPPEDRPRERCLVCGPQSLSLKECLAVILGSGPPGKGCLGVAEEIMSRCYNPRDPQGSFFNYLDSGPEVLLENISGIGLAGRTRLLASFELAFRYSSHRLENSEGPSGKPEKISRIERKVLKKVNTQLRLMSKEWIGFIPLFQGGRIGHLNVIERGVRTHVNFDARDLFAQILVLKPDGIFLFHNHPSGCLEPSQADLELTEEIAELLNKFATDFMGHWIVGPTGAKKISFKLGFG